MLEWIHLNRKIYDKNLFSDKMLNKVLKRCEKWELSDELSNNENLFFLNFESKSEKLLKIGIWCINQQEIRRTG